MSGTQPTSTRQSGRILHNLTIIIIAFTFALCGCSSEWWLGKGRGDGEIALCSGFSISRINSREVLITYKENPDKADNSIVISNYYITAYQVHDQHIYLQGIITQKLSATDEEINNRILSYYLIDATNRIVYGPFATEKDLFYSCNLYELYVSDAWIQIEDVF